MSDRFVPDDPALPGLHALFPETGAPAYLAAPLQALTGLHLDPSAASVSYVRYWPGRRCVVQWSFPGPAVGRDVLVSAELQPNRKAKSFVTAGPHLYLEDRRLMLQAFPQDDLLSGIARAVSSEWMESVLAPAMGLSAAEASTLTAAPTSYKPWRRCVIIYEARKDGRRVRAYGKLFRDDRGAELFAALQSLSAQADAAGLGWQIARPVLYDKEARLLVQAEVEGEALSDIAKLAPEDEARRAQLIETIELAAEGLPLFQQLRLEGLETAGPQQLLDELFEDIETIRGVAPDLAERLERYARRMKDLASTLAPEPLCLAHNAFRLSHVFRTASGPALIDLDGLALSGRSADAGYFLAYLAVTAAHRKRLEKVLTDCASVFLATWKENTAGADPMWRRFYAQMALLKWAVRSFYSLDPDWPDIVKEIIRAGHSVLADTDDEVQRRASLDPLLDIAASRWGLLDLARNQTIPALWPEARLVDLTDVETAYEPHEECVLHADAEIEGGDGTIRHERLVFTFRGVSPKAELPLPDAGSRFSSLHGDYLVEVYPEDFGLPGLARAQRGEYLAEQLSRAGEAPIDPAGARVQVLRYRPHERCVLLYECPDGRRYVGKLLDDRDTAVEIWSTLQNLRAQLADTHLAVKPLSIDRDTSLVLMEFVDGVSLGKLLDATREPAEAERLVSVAAQALARLHGVEFQHPRIKTLDTEINRLLADNESIRLLAPDFADEIETLVRRAAAASASNPMRQAPSFVHGGYKPTQLLVHEEEATLVDFDGSCAGDPAMDLGRFMAKLRDDALDIGRGHLSYLADYFLEEYEKSSVREVSSRARIFEATALTRMALRRLQTKPRLLRDPWDSESKDLLRLVEAALARI
jgi:aminoglycoside phosphotransferase (APT) family kinase protein